jgi:hypothetical protein
VLLVAYERGGEQIYRVIVIQSIDREKKIEPLTGEAKKISYNKALCETHLCYTPSQLKESRLAKP